MGIAPDARAIRREALVDAGAYFVEFPQLQLPVPLVKLLPFFDSA
jgi:hypothetical protein